MTVYLYPELPSKVAYKRAIADGERITASEQTPRGSVPVDQRQSHLQRAALPQAPQILRPSRSSQRKGGESIVSMHKINSLEELKRGDIVQHIVSRNSYVVAANYGESVIAVSTRSITNPSEWLVKRPANESSPMRYGLIEIGPGTVELNNELVQCTMYDEYDISTNTPTGRVICQVDNAYYTVDKRYHATSLVVSF